MVLRTDDRPPLSTAPAEEESAVEAAGGGFTDIIKLNVYVVDIAHLPQFREVRDTFIDVKNPPASTAVQVVSLVRPELLIEVEAVAVIA